MLDTPFKISASIYELSKSVNRRMNDAIPSALVVWWTVLDVLY